MKKLSLIIFLLILVFSFTFTYAEDKDELNLKSEDEYCELIRKGNLNQATIDEYCSSLGRTAKLIMQQRQLGVSLSDMINEFSQNPEQTITQKINRDIVIYAHRQKRYIDENKIKRIIEDFRDSHHLACLDHFQRVQEPSGETRQRIYQVCSELPSRL